MKVKIIEVALHELSLGTRLSERLEDLVNCFLAERPGITIAHTHVSAVALPPEEGGGRFRDDPASIVALVAIFYTE